MTKNEPHTGAGMGGYKRKPAQDRRVEWLAKMDRQYRALIEAQDARGLLALADEYETASQPLARTARAIRLYVSRMAQ